MTLRAALVLLASLAAIAAAPWAGGLGDAASFVLWELRVPRVLVAALAGGTLALVGVCYQTVFANPLASPDTVGTSAGATLGALCAVTFGGWAGWQGVGDASGLPVVTLAAFAGALLISLAISGIAARRGASVNDVLLAGIAMTLAAGALSTGLQFTADETAMVAAARWSLGHLPQVGYRGVLALLPFALPVWVLLVWQARALDALLGGEARAWSQGVDTHRVRALVLGGGALAVAACVAWCGPIAFVGLIVPHLLRLGVGASRRVLLPLAVPAGAGFLAACDMAARLVVPGREVPVGVITAGLGAPLLVWLIARRRA